MKRLQRLRSSQQIRDMVSEVGFGVANVVQPLFVVEGLTTTEPIPGLVGNVRHTIDSLKRQVGGDLEQGVRQFILFQVPTEKRARGFSNDFAAKAIRAVKEEFKESLTLWLDTCLCAVTESGHCCVYSDRGRQDLEVTLTELSAMAVVYAQAGADGISPSDMNDGRVMAIRSALDRSGFEWLPVMSYSTKFASNFYGPFRIAANSAPTFGDRKQYQLDVRNRRDAIASSVRCAEEGADLLMVKPGMPSLDLIRPIAEATGKPVGAYQVSGEYAGLHLLAKEGLMDFNAGLLESWYVLRRAGASYIITYGARSARELGLS
jgi:porphobilinogen synthase